MKKLSGPIMDRIDIHIEMRRLSEDELMNSAEAENSNTIKERVMKAREIQRKRYNSDLLNGNLGQKEIKKYCKIADEDKEYFKNAMRIMEISARGYDKILKVARTIADLEGCKDIKKYHLMEAVSFRKK